MDKLINAQEREVTLLADEELDAVSGGKTSQTELSFCEACRQIVGEIIFGLLGTVNPRPEITRLT